MPHEMDIASWDGTSMGPDDAYIYATFTADSEWFVAATLRYTERRNTTPLVDSGALDAWMLPPLHIYPTRGSAWDRNTYRRAVRRAFRRDANRDGLRYLVLWLHDGVAMRRVRIGCHVVGIATDTNNSTHFVVSLQAPGVFEDEDATVVTNPTALSNFGTETTHPTVTLTTDTHKTLRRCTVNGGGVWDAIDYPVRFALDDADAGTANVYYIVSGLSRPCYIGNPASGSSYLWGYVDIAADEDTDVLIAYGTGLTNPLCNTLDDGGMDWSSTGSTNGTIRWDDLKVTDKPGHPLSWQPAHTGSDAGIGGATYRMLGESASGMTFVRYANNTASPSDADSVAVTIPSGVNNLTNVSRVTAGHTQGVRSYGRGWSRSGGVSSVWAVAADGTETTALAFSDAVRVAIGIEFTSMAASNGATLALSKALSTAWQAVIANPPNVTVGAAEDLDYYDGELQIGDSEPLVFAGRMVPDGTLTIDAAARTITPSDDTIPPLGSVDPGPDVWLALEPGLQDITNSMGGTATFSYRSGWT